MRIALGFILMLLFSCEMGKPKILNLPQGISYKHIMLGEGDSPKVGEVVSVNMTLTSLKGDTIHYVPNYPYFFKIEEGTIDSLFMLMKPDDSITFVLNREIINEYFQFYSLKATNSGQAKLHVKLNGSFNDSEAKDIERRLLSKREIDEQANLLKLLKEDSIEYESIGGVYRRVLHSNPTGIPMAFGDEVVVNYTGSFLNGYVFDDTKNKLRTPSFIYGKEQQLIDGIHYGLNGLKEGETVKIILPSRRAFGEGGSVAGIVPPYTAVIFEIEIVKVIKT